MSGEGSPGGRLVGGRVLALVRGDITSFPADAIGNAANERLVGGGGVDGAIHRVGGPSIMADLEARYGSSRRCPTGGAVVTTAGRLPARWVIHAVGPVWRGGGHGEAALLESAYRSTLRLADEVGATSVNLPAISCGIYAYPIDEAAAIAVATVAAHLAGNTTIDRVTFVLYSEDTHDAFARAVAALGPAAAAD